MLTVPIMVFHHNSNLIKYQASLGPMQNKSDLKYSTYSLKAGSKIGFMLGNMVVQSHLSNISKIAFMHTRMYVDVDKYVYVW